MRCSRSVRAGTCSTCTCTGCTCRRAASVATLQTLAITRIVSASEKSSTRLSRTRDSPSYPVRLHCNLQCCLKFAWSHERQAGRFASRMCCTCQADLPGPPQSRANFARLSSVQRAERSVEFGQGGVRSRPGRQSEAADVRAGASCVSTRRPLSGDRRISEREGSVMNVVTKLFCSTLVRPRRRFRCQGLYMYMYRTSTFTSRH